VFYVNGGANKWVVYQSGAADWVDLNTDPSIVGIAVEDLDFGEFGPAGSKADVFRADGGDGTWYVSRDGSTAFQVLRAADSIQVSCPTFASATLMRRDYGCLSFRNNT
jgi:hypothetical protein